MFRDLLPGISIIRASIAGYKRAGKIINPGKEGKSLWDISSLRGHRRADKSITSLKEALLFYATFNCY